MGVLEKGRAAIERRMVDACTIRRADGTGTNDPDTGYPTRSYVSLYSGKCRVQQAQAQAQNEDVGEDRLLLLRLEVQLPIVGSEGLEVNDEITITAASYDVDLVGRVFTIHDLAHATEKTSRRVQCTERTGS